jgi:coproporphyrinogen III oxidase-like Fe-S oxidoreductase
MAGITLANAEAQLALWLAADAKVATNQAYSIGTRSFTRADAAEIRQNIDFWNAKVIGLSRGATGGIRMRGGIPT